MSVVVCVLPAKPTHEADKLDNLTRKRHLRSHKKSRTGCRNCKTRRVKCDEAKPDCRRCQSYGVLCDYSSKELLEPDLMVPSDGLASTGVIRLKQCSPITAMLGMVNHVMVDHSDLSVGGFGDFKMDIYDLNRLERFQTRTVISIGTKITGEVYQQQVIKLVCQHPYLMHTVMALTCMHDRYLSQEPHRRSLNELYHYGQAASLFRKKLSQVVSESDHDALWATCALLGSMSIFAIDAADPEEAWPLKQSKSDLEWLEVLDGIHAVWAIIKPTRKGSAFENLANDRSKAQLLATKNPTSFSGMESLPPALLDLCKVQTSSTVANNSYFAALHNLAPLLNMPCNQHTFLCFLAFTGHMDVTYKRLLHVKDPRALLILSYWYAKLCQGAPWFLIRRAFIECKAICLYLDRFHGNDRAIQDLLHFPKSQSGLYTYDALPLTPVSMKECDFGATLNTS